MIKEIFENIWNKNKEIKIRKLDSCIEDEETGKGFMASSELRAFAFKGKASDFYGENFPVFYKKEVKNGN